MIAVIIGTTGLVGSHLTGKLLADPDITQVLSVSRKPLGVHNPKLKQIIISHLSDLQRHAPSLEGNLYFCCLGTTMKDAKSRENFRKVDCEAVVEFARIAKNHNARSLVMVSSTGANPGSLFFYYREKGEAERELQKLKLNRLVIFRPALLIGERPSAARGEKMAIETFKRVSFLMPKALTKRITTNAETLAQRMVFEGKATQPGLFLVEAPAI